MPIEVAKKKALLIEDDVSVAGVVAGLLEKYAPGKWIVTHVTSLRDIPETVDNHPFDVILLDLNLSETFGLVTLKEAFKKLKRSQIVVLTGSDNHYQEPAFTMGAIGFATKSALVSNPGAFVSFLEECLQSSGRKLFNG